MNEDKTLAKTLIWRGFIASYLVILADHVNALEVVELLGDLGPRLIERLGVYDDHGHVVLEELAGVADVDGGLLLVAREHPDVDVGLEELGDGLGHADLELVLDGGGAEEGEVGFDELGGLGHLLLLVVDVRRGLVEEGVPVAAEGKNFTRVNCNLPSPEMSKREIKMSSLVLR